jgi:hypothetical protein
MLDKCDEAAPTADDILERLIVPFLTTTDTQVASVNPTVNSTASTTDGTFSVILVDDEEFSQTNQSTPPIYPCPFRIPCQFSSNDLDQWKTHSLAHFMGEEPPRKVSCPLCEFSGIYENGYEAWEARMNHVASHHQKRMSLEGSRYEEFALYVHLWKHRIISDSDLKALKGKSAV